MTEVRMIAPSGPRGNSGLRGFSFSQGGLNVDIARVKDRIRVLASTHHVFASVIGSLYGLRGAMLRRRGSFEHLKSTYSLLQRSAVVQGRPMNLTIEPTNACNLSCPVCETGAGILGRQKQHMSLEAFQSIIHKVGAHTNTLMFYFMGEPFLNKNSYQMIRYAKDQGIPFIDTCTNGDAVHGEKLVQSGIDQVSFQIGGMTQETHQIYRVNSKLERVFKNLKEALHWKKVYKSPIRINCGFILMKHNEHEVDLFKKTMAEFGVTNAQVIDPCVRTIEQAHSFLPTDKKHWIYDPEAISQGAVVPRMLPKNNCPWIYYSLVVHVNGDIVPCCRDPKGEEVMGNIFNESFDEIWNGPKFVDFRKRIHTKQADVSICRLCSSYPASAIH